MTKQIKSFSSHQTAKVFAVLLALGSLPMFIPMIAMSLFVGPTQDAHGNPVDFPFLMFAIFPIFYLIFGYISIRIGCWLYNLMFKYIGGFEFEVTETE